MSDSSKEISKLDDDDQEAGDGDDGVVRVELSGGFGFGKFRKAKKLVLFPFVNAKKQFVLHIRNQQKQHKKENKGVSFAPADVAGCYFCLKQPHTLESPPHSFTSDPNDSAFTYEMLKSFIEKNDFYSKECNPHLG